MGPPRLGHRASLTLLGELAGWDAADKSRFS
jgi:hypothetical protein